MEGNPVDLTVYIDDNIDHDHTYFGNGCPNGWGTDGDAGSTTPCSTRIVQSSDDENQKNGTYYTFQAATSGAGSAIVTHNAIVPDTFCPLGWQLPYGGTGGDYYNKSKSWIYLFNVYNISFNDGSIDDVYKLKSFPLSYINSGILNWNNGMLYYLNKISSGTGLYWSSTSSNEAAFRLSSWTIAIRTGGTSRKYEGDALRCSLILAKLKSNHNQKLDERNMIWHPGNEPI